MQRQVPRKENVRRKPKPLSHGQMVSREDEGLENSAGSGRSRVSSNIHGKPMFRMKRGTLVISKLPV